MKKFNMLLVAVLFSCSCNAQGYIDSLEKRMEKDQSMMGILEQYEFYLRSQSKIDLEAAHYTLQILNRMRINSNILKRYYIRHNDSLNLENIISVQMKIIRTRNKLTLKCLSI